MEVEVDVEEVQLSCGVAMVTTGAAWRRLNGGLRRFRLVRSVRICAPSSSLPGTYTPRGPSPVSTATSSLPQLDPHSLTDGLFAGPDFCLEPVLPPLSLTLLFFIFFKSRECGEMDLDLVDFFPLLL